MFDVPADQLPFWFEERAGDTALCNSARIVFSPNGDHVAFWSRRDDPALAPAEGGGSAFVRVAETDCLLSGDLACPVWQMGSPSTFNGVFWTPQGDLLLVPPVHPVRAWSPGGVEVRIALRQTSWRDWSRFQLTGLVGLGQLGVADDFPSIEDRWRVGPVTGWRGHLYATALDRSDHALTLLKDADANTAFKSGLKAQWVGEDATWAHDAAGQGYLVGGGAFHRIEGGEFRRIDLGMAHPEPIFDAAEGDLIGAFDDDEISALDQAAPPSPAPEGIDFYTSVSVHRGKRLVGRIWKALDGRQQIRIERWDGGGRTITCGKADAIRPRDVATEDWGSPERPLLVRRSRLRDGAKGVVVIYRGGPGGSIARGGATGAESKWLARGFDTVTVDGSGAVGPDFIGRLSSERLEALKTDADVVAGKLAAERLSGAVVIEGTSFGAVAAAETAAGLARRRPDANIGLLLFVPWLAYRDPADVRTAYGPAPLNPSFATLSETARFGPMRDSGRGFADQLDEWRETFSWRGPALVIFGENDALSRPSDLWRDADTSPSVEVQMDRGGHQFAGFSASAEASVDAWLQRVDDQR